MFFRSNISKVLTIGKSKVLEVDISTGIQFPRRLDEGVDKFIVFLSTNTLFLQSQVDIIVQKLFVVCSTVKDNRKGSVWVDTGAECSQDQLCNGDEDAADALVANSEDFLTIWRGLVRLQVCG